MIDSRVLTVLLLLLLFFPVELRAASGDIVATVGQEPITLGQLQLEADWIKRQSFHVRDDDASVAKRMKLALRKLIDRQLLFVAVSTVVPVNCQRDDVKKKMADLIKKAGGEQVLATNLRTYAFDIDDYRLTICKQIVGDEYIEELAKTITPDPLAVAAYYKKNKKQFVQPASAGLELIYKPVIPGSLEAENAESIAAKVARIAEKWKKGATAPGALAKELGAKYSDMGMVHEGAPIPEMNEAVFGSKAMGVLPVLRNKFGFYLIKVNERVSSKKLSLSESKIGIARQLAKTMLSTAKRKLMDKAKKMAPVQFLDPRYQRSEAPAK